MTSDQIQAISAVSRGLSTLNRAKLDLEYAVQILKAKGLAPNPDGSLPEAVVLTDGVIDGTDLPASDYVMAMGGISQIVSVLESEIVDGFTVEAALLRASR